MLFRCSAIALALVHTAGVAGAQPTSATEPETQADWLPGWTPVDRDGWPRGATLEQLRELPECGLGDLVVTPGAPIPCRPPVLAGPGHVAFSLDWTSGLVFDDRTSGGAHALGAELLYAATRANQLGVRYELMGIGGPEDVGGIGNQLFALARHRLFTDEVDRDAWTVGAGIGWAFRDDSIGGFAPIARLALAREVGLYVDDNNAMTAAIEVAYERTLDDDALSALLASVKLGFELDIREPRNLGTPETPHSRHYTVSGDVLLSPGLGFGMTLGLRASSLLSLETSASYLFGFNDMLKQQGFDGSSWAVQSGPRLSLDSWLTPYVQVQAGPSWVSELDGAEVRWVGTGELGVRGQSCGAGVDVGAWLRSDLEDGLDVVSGGLVLRLVMGSGRYRQGGGSCGRGSTPTFATKPPRPAPPVVYQPPPVTSPPSVRIDVGGAGAVGGSVATGGSIQVEVRPIVVEVALGAVLFGGAIQVRIDPRLLPLGPMRGAGFVAVELSGPASALSRFQGQLGAVIGRGGGQVHAWTTVPTGSSVVRARFTIWPPGVRGAGPATP